MQKFWFPSLANEIKGEVDHQHRGSVTLPFFSEKFRSQQMVGVSRLQTGTYLINYD